MGGNVSGVPVDGALDEWATRGRDRQRTTTEEVLSAIWCNVLQVGSVAPGDDFFALGGSSVLALQVAVRVEETLGARLTLPELFEHRTPRELAAAVDGGLGREGGRGAIERRERRRGPVSLAQAAMLSARKAKGVPTVSRLFRLVGPLDTGALERALNEVVRRHEILRTVYRSTGRRQRQVVLPWSPVPLLVVDARDARRGAAVDVRQAVAENVIAPFDLGAGPVIRWKLLRLAGNDHLLSLSLHEIAGDGWSVPVLLTELGILYDDFTAGRPPSLSPPALQYLDFAVWQRRHLGRGARRQQLRYWKERLRGAPLALDLLPDRWPATFGEPEPRVAEARLSAALMGRVDALARREGCSQFLVLAAALQALVHRLTGSPSVVVRPTFANRTTAQIEPMIGFFVNYLVVATDASGDPTFRELLARVRRDFLDATTQADVPFQGVLRRVARMKTANARWPAGQVRFQLFNFPEEGVLVLPGVRVEAQDHGVVASEHLALSGAPMPDGSVHLRLHYDGSMYGKATMERLLARYRGLLEQTTATPDIRVSAMSLLDPAEWREVRRAAGAPVAMPVEPVELRVAQHAARTPDAVAVATTTDAVTYGELDRWADAVGGRLDAVGAGHGAPVLLVASAGPGFTAGLLGILRAGATCMPIDPHGRRETLDAILRHARPVAALVDADVAASLPCVTASVGHVVVVDELRAGAAVERPRPTGTPPPATPGGLALYTSVDGGAPRAVFLSPDGLARVASAQSAVHRLRPADRVAELPRPQVGAVPYALCATLSTGATYVVAGVDEAPAAWVATERITVCFADGPTTRACMSTSTSASPRSALRLLVCDEAVVAPEGRSAVTVVEQSVLTEAGGPWAIARQGRSDRTPAFCGTPLPGVQAFVVDASMNPAPPLVPGEVVVSGAPVPWGLPGGESEDAGLGDDAPTWAGGARLVRTGLIARVDSRQQIELLGVGEGDWSARGAPMGVYLRRIEAAVRAHPSVGAVVARLRDVHGEPRVTVHVVPVPGAAVRVRDVRPLLPRGLPPFAKPVSIAVRERFPRRLDGRIDYEALGD